MQKIIKGLEPQNDFEAKKLSATMERTISNSHSFRNLQNSRSNSKNRLKDETSGSKMSSEQKINRVNMKLGYNRSTGKNHVPYQNFHHKLHFKTIEQMFVD